MSAADHSTPDYPKTAYPRRGPQQDQSDLMTFFGFGDTDGLQDLDHVRRASIISLVAERLELPPPQLFLDELGAGKRPVVLLLGAVGGDERRFGDGRSRRVGDDLDITTINVRIAARHCPHDDAVGADVDLHLERR